MEKTPGENPFDEPLRILHDADPEKMARLAGASLEQVESGERLVLPVLDGTISVTFPDIEIEAQPKVSSFVLKLLAVIYLGKTDGSEPEGRWVAYRELPGGRFYEPVVARSVEDPIALAYGGDLDAFDAAARSIGGAPEEIADRAYSFLLFPRVKVCLAVHAGDEEFDAGARVLFDAACSHHLNPFELRMGAEAIASRLLKSPGR
ncbi:MAG: DUF3786 domain-containing protein [Actinobacteria bacterium]|nr:DUF3786 domain-containing protein [Actinomycetota bacterium]MBU2687609.1 DUF3786 domain-containing protein [Actinomycetota bacterium]